MANATTNAILDNIRARLPGIPDDAAKLELFNTVDELAREALRTTAPTNVDAEPDTWLSSDLWVPNYAVVLEGTLARLYAQVNKPWFSGELAKVHSDRYMVLLGLARQEASGSPATVYDRLLANLRVQIPMARDAALRLEIYNTVDKIRREALRLAPLTGAETDPATWLPSDKWDDCYQAILHGALARFFSQTGNPWANPQMAAAQLQLFVTELELVRNEAASSAAYEFDKIMDMARARLPGARDNLIKLEFVAVMAEFFQQSNCWREDITLKVIPGKTEYDLFPTQVASIVRLLEVRDTNNLRISATMPEVGTLKLFSSPSQETTYTVTVALSIDAPVDRDGMPVFPNWFLQKYSYDLLDGLCARMMSQLAKPYTQPQLAASHRRLFMSAINVARAEAMHEQTYQGQRWSFPQTFARRKARF